MKFNNVNGIWFFGLSGVGKSYASNLVFKRKTNSIIIDGDEVRKYISTDLDYSLQSRNIQIKRIYGLAKIAVKSQIYPIISSVWMHNELAKKLYEDKIRLIQVDADMKQIFAEHNTYKNQTNVVGKDIKYGEIECTKITNKRNLEFWKTLEKLI
tara:strand:- start:24 stop:485 length:462 start_codon:yes stop_codon:yes gene_type:complete